MDLFHNLLHHREVKKATPLRPGWKAMVDEIKTMGQEIERLQLLQHHKTKRMWLIIEEDLHYYGEMDMDLARGLSGCTERKRKTRYNKPTTEEAPS